MGTLTAGEVRAWLAKEVDATAPKGAAVEWTDAEGYVSLPRPGGDGWVTFDAASGEVLHERTDRGPIAYLNDLHKGRNSGAVWSLFLDVFAIGCIVFCATGLVLLQLHSRARKFTWPLVGLGLAVPLILVLLFILPFIIFIFLRLGFGLFSLLCRRCRLL